MSVKRNPLFATLLEKQKGDFFAWQVCGMNCRWHTFQSYGYFFIPAWESERFGKKLIPENEVDTVQIYMIRHGQTDRNVRAAYYGLTQAALTEEGKEQARSLGAYFKESRWKRVFVSPLERTLDTARLFLSFSAAPIPIEQDPLLMEQNFGIFEDQNYEELCVRFPQEMKLWNADFSDYRIPQGESFRDVRKRVDHFVQARKAEVASGLARREDKILIVAHKGTLGHMTASFLGLPLEGYWNFVFEQGAYSRIDLEDGYAIVRKLNQSVR